MQIAFLASGHVLHVLIGCMNGTLSLVYRVRDIQSPASSIYDLDEPGTGPARQERHRHGSVGTGADASSSDVMIVTPSSDEDVSSSNPKGP